MTVKFRNTICPPPPFIGELRCQAIQAEHGPYIAERTQKAVYILWDVYDADALCILESMYLGRKARDEAASS
jgi:hypothetical protein